LDDVALRHNKLPTGGWDTRMSSFFEEKLDQFQFTWKEKTVTVKYTKRN